MFDTNCLVFLPSSQQIILINILHVSNPSHILGWRACIQKLHHRKLGSRSTLCYWIYACCSMDVWSAYDWGPSTVNSVRPSSPTALKRSAEHSKLIPVMISDTWLGNKFVFAISAAWNGSGTGCVVKGKDYECPLLNGVCVRCGWISACV
jgi:hypothetical protein